MKQQLLFAQEKPKQQPAPSVRRTTINGIPKRMTWREDGLVYRGRPWCVSPAIGVPQVYKVWITHTPRGYDLGWNRIIGAGQVLAAK